MADRKPKPLATRLRCARELVRIWKRALEDSHQCLDGGPDHGKVTDERMIAELRLLDEAYAALTEAIKIVKGNDRG